jgi:hypothetical protein
LAKLEYAQDLRNKIEKFMQDPDYAEKISQAGHYETVENRTMDQDFNRILKICEEAENFKK